MKMIENGVTRFLNSQSSTGAGTAGAIFDVWSLTKGRRRDHEALIRAACQSVYLGDHIALCRVLGRYKMYVDTTDVGIAGHLILDGYWEMWNTEAMLNLVRPGMTVLDVGANCGYFTVLLAEIVGAAGRVHAFEPNPPMAALLRRTISINGFDGRVTLHEIALGERNGRARLAVPANEPKNAYVVEKGSKVETVNIIAARADGMPDLLDADFIKIDAEGAEEGIWRGMAGLFARKRPLTIILEFTPGRYVSAANFLNEILSEGFSLQVVDFDRGVVPTSVDEVLAGPPAEDQMLVLSRG